MIRYRLVFLIAALAMGFATYELKYGVQNLAQNLLRVQRQTVAATEKIRDLRAEWAYLTQPRRLARLNDDLLKLQPVTTQQLMTPITDIPFRPEPDAAPGLIADAGGGADPAASLAPAALRATPAALVRPELLAAATASPGGATRGIGMRGTGMPGAGMPRTGMPGAATSGTMKLAGIAPAGAAPSLDALFAEVAGSR